MKDTEQALASLQVVDAKGFAVAQPTFDQAPSWVIDDPSIATIAVSQDGLSCNVVAQKPGTANLSVSAAAAGQSFAGTLPVMVTAGDAAQISIALGAPTPQ